ncbi:hypothetical protein [Spirochaeta isovalerica]|uniref:EF-hand domain-containing protein n=1 Tax=Spirochaeta isovalerica TaxID=150 RepID=A0A841RCA5_9SPIO|nr:hypothetical protein [Spirochaeta isovalerica]MBB6480857.1 hypothetical protein [Spirochaeta isovalerica]
MKNILYLLFFLSTPLVCQAVSAYDTNDDGEADKWIEDFADGHMKITVDSDYNGVVDRVIRFDSEGRTDYEEYDFDLDGLIDTYYFYGEEGLERQEIDSNGDGKIDIWVHLYKGMFMKSYERDTDFDGIVDQKKEYGSE